MEDRIREIVATFLRISPDRIGPDTRIDRPALQSSILLHRMYARLEEQGFQFDNYGAIQVFGDLLRQQQMAGQTAPEPERATTAAQVPLRHIATGAGSIGIDIQDIQALPRTDDFRTDVFYRMNFTPAEISYCILQPDPYTSFGGLFAAKEAVVKADAARRSIPFNTIEIGHTAEGAPLIPDFHLSISHAGGFAVAVAAGENVLLTAERSTPPALTLRPAASAKRNYLAWIALLLALLSIILVLWHQKAAI